MQNRLFLAGVASCALALAAPATAHVTLETQKAPADSAYRGVLRVGHGCDGKPTTTIRVRIPAGVIAVKPMPKPGWELAVTKAAYGQTYDYYGTPVSEGVTEITWSGGELPDDFYDEFVFRARLTAFATGATVYFPVVQECTEGVHRWIEIPEAGRTADDYDEPAPGVVIIEKPSS